MVLAKSIDAIYLHMAPDGVSNFLLFFDSNTEFGKPAQNRLKTIIKIVVYATDADTTARLPLATGVLA